MRNFLLLLVTLLTFTVGKTYANHVAGGQITYKYLSSAGNNHTYEVEIVIFGDCDGSTFSTFTSTTAAGLIVYKGGATYQTMDLPRIYPESDILISPVCPTAINQTTCTSGGTLVGIKKFTFRGNVVLDGGHAEWRFVFNGNLVNGSSAGRSTLADNATGLGTFYIAATLNNLAGQNSSPTFTSDPTPFYCVNIPASFGLGAVDPDGDNMTYSLVPAITNALGTGTVNYIAPYTAVAPLNAVAGTFTFSTVSGVAEFIPAAAPWEGIVVSKVSEMRNGIEVGTAAREMMFVFLQNCTNTSASTPITNVSNGEMLPSTSNSVEFKVCEAQQVNFTFEMSPIDPQNDNITVTSTNLPAGATLNVTNDGTPNPTVQFDWNLGAVSAGTYQFFITFTDDGCPLSSVKTVSYTVHVQQFSGNFTTGSQEPCRNMSNGFAWILPDPNDTSLYKYTWMDPAFNILSTTTGLQNHGDTLDNLLPGVYLVEVENYRGCKRRYSVMVDSPTYNVKFEVPDVICVNTTVPFNPNYPNNDFESLFWDFGNGTTSTDQFPALQYPVPGLYTITLIGTTEIGCKDTFTQQIQVDSIMRPEFDLERYEICVGDKIEGVAQYGSHVTDVNWNFGDGGTLHSGPVGEIEYAYPAAGTYNITMRTSYRSCPDVLFSRSVTVHDYPRVYLGSDTGLCYQGQPIELKNMYAGVNGDRYLWNTGATTPTILANHHGVYSLTVTRNDCATTDSVTISKDCYIDIPNAFVPGSGDQSGYFMPRSLLAKGVAQFDMTIFNRWGERVFFTSNPDGRGWDGTLNGQQQPQGVYIYQINVTYKDGKTEKYQGNVTLMR